MATYYSNDFRAGLKIMLDGEPYAVEASEFVKPGKGQAFARVKLRRLLTGTRGVAFQAWIGFNDFQLNEVRRGDRDRLAVPQGHDALSLIQQPFSVVTDRFRVSRQLLEGFVVHEVPELTVVVQVSQVHIDNVRAFCGIGRFESFLNAGTGGKPATLSTGAVVKVPLFVQIGEVIKVDTRSGEYVSRVK